MKKQGDVIVYSRNSVLINALVAFSRQVFLPEGPTEHLTLVYLDPAAASAAPTGEQLRNSIKVQADVPPLAEGAVNGWKEVEADRIEGSPREASEVKEWNGVNSEAVARQRYENELNSLKERGLMRPHEEAILRAKDEVKQIIVISTPTKPTAADLDAHAAEDQAKADTAAREVEIVDRGEDYSLPSERFAVSVNNVNVWNFPTREEAQAYIDKGDFNPPAAQDAAADTPVA